MSIKQVSSKKRKWAGGERERAGGGGRETAQTNVCTYE
jgi:hypothetical protein